MKMFHSAGLNILIAYQYEQTARCDFCICRSGRLAFGAPLKTVGVPKKSFDTPADETAYECAKWGRAWCAAGMQRGKVCWARL